MVLDRAVIEPWHFLQLPSSCCQENLSCEQKLFYFVHSDSGKRRNSLWETTALTPGSRVSPCHLPGWEVWTGDCLASSERGKCCLLETGWLKEGIWVKRKDLVSSEVFCHMESFSRRREAEDVCGAKLQAANSTTHPSPQGRASSTI